MFYRVALTGITSLLLASCQPTQQQESAQSAYGNTPLTFNQHIAPIIFEHCAVCHRKGEAGPFPLVSYRDVKKRAKMIAHVTETRFMPPWPANREYQSYANERGLSDEQIAMIQRWYEEGAPEGSSDKLPPLPDFDRASALGSPDMIVSMKDTVWIPGNNRDLFLYIKVPFELPADTFLRAVEFVPGNRQLVHHMNGSLINYPDGKKSDIWQGETIIDPDTTDSFSAYHYMKLLNDDGTYPPLSPSMVNYLPGVEAVAYPEGIGGYYLKRQAAFLMQTMHYGPSALDTFDLSHFKLWFSDTPPKRPMRELQMGTLGDTPVIPEFIIPADSVITFKTSYRVPQDWSVLTINPHMHLLGREFLAYAIRPDGDTIPLVHLPRWDFRWQYFYTFEHMLKIPKGSKIEVWGTFDNTANNPFQPFDPPQTIREPKGDMKTTDEMFQFFVNYVLYEEGDEEIPLHQ